MERIAYAHCTPEFSSPAALKPVRNEISPFAAIPVNALGPMLVVSPHPDDETLGCGGLIARCALLACPVTVLAMTNGEASHPGDTAWQRRLGETRRHEQQNALRTLGLENPDLISLALPDGAMDQLSDAQSEQVHEQILAVMESRGVRTVLVPAVDDRHGDHRATARILARAALAHPSLAYFFSYQIWPATVRNLKVTANECGYAHDISDVLDLKRAAVREHRSQLGPTDPAHTDGFCMPGSLLDAKLTDTESLALIRDIATWSE